MRWVFTTLKTKIIFHPKCVFQATMQGPSPAVSIIRGKLTRCEVLQSFRKEKGPVSHCILNCIFPFKACVWILHRGPDGPAPFSCFGPAEVGEGKGSGGQGPRGSVSWCGTVCREQLFLLSFTAGTTLTGVGCRGCTGIILSHILGISPMWELQMHVSLPD